MKKQEALFYYAPGDVKFRSRKRAIERMKELGHVIDESQTKRRRRNIQKVINYTTLALEYCVGLPQRLTIAAKDEDSILIVVQSDYLNV
ncbi:hypothetical protein FRX31_009668 [Thalictrum thalictroides]|uniref:Uncharacterized protein n=1 Tax=Thalictrum thalictroides TaxID=46969 RepID=A0A7J6WTL7_THATH|nr:hypothetical protein FRX31_009668 [Thalictrum thalictroides]